ncbi:MAG: hypothetical protein UX25_C0011G0006 [Candidatus Woesebacteria bacterium GW2011_GWC2_45_9]|uniref:Glycosyltransferase n=2 Tax=Microgenomates group TaxID=1794810 RepID=A0A0G1R8U3_9BACT|nr:MAG: hypothetical protein UW61_C0004G0009 [Candidatus Curtissbacteria bacterium GW2011_GWC1_44_33]KKU17335.1 MAG: hypothetical protein UX25_C0011G0006 [Candidatus Woesebacteria bacterium GW2011_GWC2_45_9]
MKKPPKKSLKKLLTVIYYTSNREDEAFERKIRAKLLQVIGDLPLISVSQKQIDFGKNICVGNVGISNQNAFRQFQLGAINAKTPFVVAAEADCLYPREYFEYLPPSLNTCHRYDNVWIMYKYSKAGFVRKAYSECAQVWGREILIRHIEKRLKGRGRWRPTLEHGGAVPTMFGRQGWGYFQGEIPVINIKTIEGMHLTTGVIKGQDPQGVKKLPFWGTVKKLRKEMFPRLALK